ncbi:MAG: aspartate dehydrogenase [Clostridia bacterium]|nr:aspartate dehydrogenase [Clostridia bacterium]
MSLFKRKPKAPAVAYDPQTQQPAVRRSICTGEMTVGFIDRRTGQFHDLRRVDGQKELEEFRQSVGAAEIRTIY